MTDGLDSVCLTHSGKDRPQGVAGCTTPCRAGLLRRWTEPVRPIGGKRGGRWDGPWRGGGRTRLGGATSCRLWERGYRRSRESCCGGVVDARVGGRRRSQPATSPRVSWRPPCACVVGGERDGPEVPVALGADEARGAGHLGGEASFAFCEDGLGLEVRGHAGRGLIGQERSRVL